MGSSVLVSEVELGMGVGMGVDMGEGVSVDGLKCVGE